tara:strand:- start:518 stop:862 length:345 start_codon:yes stop_codon:yes gene_type:complete
MKNRYFDRRTFLNDDENYKREFLDNKRDAKSIVQYDTAVFRYPSVEEIAELQIVEVVWGSSSRLFNLADKYYNDPTLWWVIAMFNQKPTEAHFILGETVFIPLPLEKVLRTMRA